MSLIWYAIWVSLHLPSSSVYQFLLESWFGTRVSRCCVSFIRVNKLRTTLSITSCPKVYKVLKISLNGPISPPVWVFMFIPYTTCRIYLPYSPDGCIVPMPLDYQQLYINSNGATTKTFSCECASYIGTPYSNFNRFFTIGSAKTIVSTLFEQHVKCVLLCFTLSCCGSPIMQGGRLERGTWVTRPHPSPTSKALSLLTYHSFIYQWPFCRIGSPSLTTLQPPASCHLRVS